MLFYALEMRENKNYPWFLVIFSLCQSTKVAKEVVRSLKRDEIWKSFLTHKTLHNNHLEFKYVTNQSKNPICDLAIKFRHVIWVLGWLALTEIISHYWM